MRRLVLSLMAVSFMLVATPALADYPDDCLGLDTPSGGDCGDISTIGCCDEAGRVVWCDADQVYCIDCAAAEDEAYASCGWSADAGFYDCGPEETEDPSGANPRPCEGAPENCGDGTCQDGEGENCSNCPEDCGCEDGQTCFDGACCTADCTDKECGDDGCGGSCGECDAGMVCSDDFVCAPPEDICTAAQEVVCDDVIEGDNTGAASVIASACGSWETAGPEVVYSFVAEVDDMLMLTLEETGGVDHDIGIMTNYCNEVACLASGDTELNVEITAGNTYYIVIDGYTAEDVGTFTLTVGCQSTCVPDCDGKECGDDGCGGTCGEEECTGFCIEGVCYDEGGCAVEGEAGCGGCDCEACVCELDPFCCGNDEDGEGTWDQYCQISCLQECGGCGLAANCGDGECKGAENCNNCADDCGCTGEGEVCAPTGECCVPDCEGKVCGDDGCGGSCGECDPGLACSEGQCVEAMISECNGTQEPSGDDCMGLTETGCCDSLGRTLWCQEGKLFCIDCAANNPECGWNAEYSWYDCGTDGAADPTGANPMECEGMTCSPPCEAGFTCVDGECVECTPDCEGKECGDDGCGGTCGECGEGFNCDAGGQCIAEGDVCLGFGEPSGPNCGDVSETGCCDENGRLKWCQGGELYCADCAGSGNPTCGWNADQNYYDCGTDGAEDPTGQNPFECPETTCTPNCAGMECGDDGCGGSCGTCDAGFECQGGTCVEEGTCTPDCAGKTCGDDGCGGSCGSCDAGFTCNAGQCVEDVTDNDVITGDDTIEDDTTDPGTDPTGGDDDGGSSCSTSTSGNPATMLLFGLMMLGLAVIRRRATQI